MENLKHINKFHKRASFGESFTYFLNFIVSMKHAANITYNYIFAPSTMPSLCFKYLSDIDIGVGTCSAYTKTEPIARAPNTTSKCTHISRTVQLPQLGWNPLLMSYTMYTVYDQGKQRVGSKITCRPGSFSKSCFILLLMI